MILPWIMSAVAAIIAAQNSTTPSTGANCNLGDYRCTPSTTASFDRCVNNAWITFQCAPGTVCQGSNSTILCTFPSAAGAPSSPCSPDGAFQCNSAATGFFRCADLAWIAFQCPPGTTCQSDGTDSILCGLGGTNGTTPTPSPSPPSGNNGEGSGGGGSGSGGGAGG